MSQDNKKDTSACRQEAEDIDTTEANPAGQEAAEPAGEGMAGNQEEQNGREDSSHKDDRKKDPKDAQIEELQDRLKRQMAEFDNFRKRTEKEKTAMYEIGARARIWGL